MIAPPTDENLARAAALLSRGELVGVPTETVYGLAADALDAAAVARIFAAKERPTFDPLIVHVAAARGRLAALEEDGVVAAGALAPSGRERAETLMAAFWPGPLTLVLPRGPRVPDLVASGLPTVAVRVPRHPVAQALLERAGRPLAAPSANRFGRISPTCAQDVEDELHDRVAMILDGGRCPIGVESTVVAVAPDGALTLLRPGGTPVEEIARAVGVTPSRPTETGEAAAPGMLPSHYAPRAKVVLLDGPLPDDAAARFQRRGQRLGVLAQAGDAAALRARLGVDEVRVLSPTGDEAEAARNLFAALRALDEAGVDPILAELPPDARGLRHAIRDRLVRAAAR